MVSPNALCGQFADWCLNSGYWRQTTSQAVLTQDIKTAADAGTEVSDNDWNNWVRISSPYWEAFNCQLAQNNNSIYISQAYSWFLC